MVRKRLDDRIRALFERSVATGQRSMLVLVGDHGKDQVCNLHHILSKLRIQQRPNVLWCYKKDLGFSTHRTKRMKKLKRDKQRGLLKGLNDQDSQADNFELFMGQTDITWCYYKDSHRALGQTYGVVVLQDFEALTPNIMARTVETCAGGGLVIFLMRTVKSLKQLYSLSMDVHSRYRTEAAGDVTPRFNERFILSLAKCSNCLVCDDELNILPVSRKALRSLTLDDGSREHNKGDAGEVLVERTAEEQDLEIIKDSVRDTPHVGVLVDLTKTLDQAKAVLVFLEACAEKNNASDNNTLSAINQSTVSMTAARGRGKSAAVGLCLAGAIALGYSNVVVTAPEPDNLVAVFDFVLRGLKALKYQEHMDYSITYNANNHYNNNNNGGNSRGSDPNKKGTKFITAIHIFRTHRQGIQYYRPDEKDKFVSAEIVAVDEAAAIPLPTVRALLSGGNVNTGSIATDRLTFLSSTVNGYEGTGRSLSLKLLQELRDSKGRASTNAAASAAAAIVGSSKGKKGEVKVHEQRWAAAASAVNGEGGDQLTGPLREIELLHPIRYALGDPVEAWLNQLLCLDCGDGSNLKLRGGAPAPSDCELYQVDRDALFSRHVLAESFLQQMWALYTAAHYKNTPNDLFMLSDAPAHSVYVLLSPNNTNDNDTEDVHTKKKAGTSLPDILAVVQVATEGRISRKAVQAQLARGHRSAGDLIPWTISQQFSESTFAQLSGARIVRIAVHPSVQGMGYGSRAVQMLYRFYNGEMEGLMNANVSDSDDDDDEEDDDGDEEDDLGTDNNENDEVSGSGLRGEMVKPRKELPPLLQPLTEVKPPKLDWIGTSFGLTESLHKFWGRAGMQMLYCRQTCNDLTGEHSAIMLRALRNSDTDASWLHAFVGDFKRRWTSLLGGSFRQMNIRLALSVISNMKKDQDQEIESPFAGKNSGSEVTATQGRPGAVGLMTANELDFYLTPYDLKRLELYGRNLCDYHLVTDLLPTLARLYFQARLNCTLSNVQAALLCGIGLQYKTVDDLRVELGLPSTQVLAMFNKAVRKLSMTLNALQVDREKQSLLSGADRQKAEKALTSMRDVSRQTLEEDVTAAAKEAMDTLAAQQKQENANLPPIKAGAAEEFMEYAVKGSDEQWSKALEGKSVIGKSSGGGTVVQIQESRPKRKLVDDDYVENESKKEKTLESKKGKKKKKSKRKSRD